MINKDRYIELAANLDLPISMQPWWMDATSIGKHWEGLVFEDHGKVIGMAAIHWMEKYGIKMAATPLLTPMTPIWINSDDINMSDTKARKEYVIKEIDNDLKLLNIDTLKIKTGLAADASIFNTNGIKTTPRHTYVINDISSPDRLIEHYHKMKSRNIRKAINAGYELHENAISADEYYEIYKGIMAERNETVAYSSDYFTHLANEAIAHGQGTILSLNRPGDFNPETAMLCVWDNTNAYALAYWTRPEARNTGSSSLIFHRAIEKMSGTTKHFDFEGGMNKNVGESYSRFASTETPYLMAEKSYSTKGMLAHLLLKAKTE